MLKDEMMFMRKKSGGKSPVMDGLLLWYDAVDYGYSDAWTMTNRVDGSVHRISGYNPPNAFSLIGDNKNVLSLTVPNTGEVYGYFPILKGNIATIEMVAGVPNGRRIGIYASQSNSNPRGQGVYFSTTNEYVTTVGYYGRPASGNQFVDADYGKTQHLIMTSDGSSSCLYSNGEFVGIFSDKVVRTYIYPLVLFTFSATGSIVKFGCSRIYDRVLTDDDVRQNYNYELSLGRITV